MKLINITLTILFMLIGESTFASILWMGGEDIDFPNGNPVSVVTTAGYYRSGYAREAIYATSGIGKSNPFPGGAVTSVWLSFREYAVSGPNATPRLVGLGKSGSSNSLWLGNGNSFNSPYIALYKYDGTTLTQLAISPSGTLGNNASLNAAAVVMHVTNYGTSATVDVYNSTNQSAAPLFSYTGDVTAGGNTSLDSVFLGATSAAYYMSEIIVSDVDPRTYSLVTLAPNAAGDSNLWTNTYTNVNPATINDTNYITDNTSGDIFECKMNALPAGTFNVLSVKVAARGQQVTGGVASLSVGVKTNATISAPTAVSQPAAFGLTESYFSINPVTSSAWTTGDVNALQINLQSAP